MPKIPIPVYIDTPDNIKADTTPTFTQVPIGHKPEIVNKYRFNESNYQGSLNRGVSMTVPNETYTIRELLNKHTKGIMPDIEMKAIYVEASSHEDFDLMKIQRMDISEKQEIKTHQTNLIEQLEEQQKERLEQKASQVLKSENEVKAQKDAESEK